MKPRTIKELKNLKGKRVLLRLGLNAAVKNGKVIGGYRIKQIIPTIAFPFFTAALSPRRSKTRT